MEKTGANRNDKGPYITGGRGAIELTKWAFCHEVIFELLFAQKYSASPRLMLVLIITKNAQTTLLPADMIKNRTLRQIFFFYNNITYIKLKFLALNVFI